MPGTLNELQQFLKSHKVKSGDNITHTRIGDKKKYLVVVII